MVSPSNSLLASSPLAVVASLARPELPATRRRGRKFLACRLSRRKETGRLTPRQDLCLSSFRPALRFGLSFRHYRKCELVRL
jgi:hypothetical protein